MPSPETIANLKKQCEQAKKKNLSFYYFAKAENGEPALLMGKAAAVRTEQKALATQHKTKPVAHGIVKKSEDGGKLVFELFKGKPAPLEKALKTTFNEVPLLKGANVTNHSDQVSLKDKVSGALKGGNDAFKRRAGKLNDAFAEASLVIHALEKEGVPVSTSVDRLDDLREALDAAESLSETDPKDAYTALAPVKDEVQKLLTDLRYLRDNIQQQRTQATTDHKIALSALGDARKVLTAVTSAGYETTDEAAQIEKLTKALAAAEQRIRPEPLQASADIQKLTPQLKPILSALSKKKENRAASFEDVREDRDAVENNTLARRISVLRESLNAAKASMARLTGYGVQTQGEADTLKDIQATIDGAERDGGRAGLSALDKARTRLATFEKAASAKLTQHAQLRDDRDAAWALIARARERYEALALLDTSHGIDKDACSTLLGRLSSAEALASSNLTKALSAIKQLQLDARSLLDQLSVAQKESPHAATLLFQSQTEKMRRYLAEVQKDDTRLGHLLLSPPLHEKTISNHLELVDQAQKIAEGSPQSASQKLKQVRTMARQIHAQIQQQLTTLPQQLKAIESRRLDLLYDIERTTPKLNLLRESKDLRAKERTLADIQQVLTKVKESAATDPEEAQNDLEIAARNLRTLAEDLDLLIAEGALTLSDVSLPELPLQQKRQLALLWIKLRTAQDLAKAQATHSLTSSDQKLLLAQAQDQIAAVSAMLEDNEKGAEDRLKTVTATVDRLVMRLEARGRSFDRITQKLSQYKLDQMPANTGLWIAFTRFAASEISTENALFFQMLIEGKLSSPSAKKEAYLQFISETAPQEINASVKERKGCFPNSAFPSTEALDDTDMWARVSYDSLKQPLETNLSDTLSRFRRMVPLTILLRTSPLAESEKHITAWEAALQLG